MRQELSHDPPPIVPQEPVLVNTVPNPTDQNPEPKDVYDYHCGFMNMTLLLRNIADATKEGDGERIIRCIGGGGGTEGPNPPHPIPFTLIAPLPALYSPKPLSVPLYSTARYTCTV